MTTKRDLHSGKTLTLAGIPIVALAGALALGSAFIVASPHPALAFECDNTGGAGSDNADDDGDDTNTACGSNAIAWGGDDNNNSAFGESAEAGDPDAAGFNNTAIGQNANAGNSEDGDDGGDDNTAIGQNAQAGVGDEDSDENTAVGQNAQAGIGDDSEDNTAIGNDARAGIGVGADRNTAIGEDADAGVGDDSTNNIALGEDAQAGVGTNSNYNIAIGNNSGAGEGNNIDDAIAIGGDAHANFSNSLALGADVNTTRANQYLFGGADTNFTLPGITSDSSRAMQSGPLEFVTSDAGGNLATTNFGAVDQLLSNTEQIKKNTEGIAMAMALGGFWVPYNKRFAVSAGGGFFDDAVAASVQAGLQISDNVHFTGGLAIGTSDRFDDQQLGGRVNLLLSW